MQFWPLNFLPTLSVRLLAVSEASGEFNCHFIEMIAMKHLKNAVTLEGNSKRDAPLEQLAMNINIEQIFVTVRTSVGC